MKIYKYGGNILKNETTRKSIYKHLKEDKEKKIIVVSAIKDTPYATDQLLNLIHHNTDYYMQERLLTTGEMISTFIICNELKNLYVNCDFLYPEEIGIEVIKEKDQIQITNLNPTIIEQKLKQCDLLICPGFTATDQNHKIVSLNRGGSDLTAVLLAKMLNVSEVTFFKDVAGVSLCNPKYFSNNKILTHVGYDKMILFAKHGSNLLQLDALKKAKEYQIALRIKHFALCNEGTLIDEKKGDSSLSVNILNNKIYIDGFTNILFIKKILFENNIPYDLLLCLGETIEITTHHHNENEIFHIVCSSLFRS